MHLVLHSFSYLLVTYPTILKNFNAVLHWYINLLTILYHIRYLYTDPVLYIGINCITVARRSETEFLYHYIIRLSYSWVTYLFVSVLIWKLEETLILFFRYVKSDKSKILLNLCLSLTIALIVFLLGVEQTQHKVSHGLLGNGWNTPYFSLTIVTVTLL